MLKVYNSVLSCARGLVSVAGAIPGGLAGKGKARLFIDGQNSALADAAKFRPGKENYFIRFRLLRLYKPINCNVRICTTLLKPFSRFYYYFLLQ